MEYSLQKNLKKTKQKFQYNQIKNTELLFLFNYGTVVIEQHLGDIQWYFNLLGLTLIQLAAACNPTQDLTDLFIIYAPVVLSFLTLKTPA